VSHSPLSAPSPLLVDNVSRIRAASRLGMVVDLACGRGRHALWLGREGIPCLGIDRNEQHLRELRVAAGRAGLRLDSVRTDLEAGLGIPLKTNSCGSILVFRFLFRPLMPEIAASLRPGGILLYETFAAAHRETGRGPRNPAFYLERDELPGLFPELEVLAYEEGPTQSDPPDITARLLARKPAAVDPG
jgi:tellurite methyltransferase